MKRKTTNISLVAHMQSTLNELEDEIYKNFREMTQKRRKLERSKKENGAILKELGEIEFLITELQKNMLSLQSEELKSLHEERISDLKLRKLVLENRQQFYAPSEYEEVGWDIIACQTTIDLLKESVKAQKNKIAELQNAEKAARKG